MIDIPVWSLYPFFLLLLSIALFPIVLPEFWHNNVNKFVVSICLALPVAILFIVNDFTSLIYHSLLWEYAPFVILIGGLFVITGGLFISGDIRAEPLINATYIFVGVVLASVIGTTGASMLLIRSLIQTNSERRFKSHTIVFFIMAVGNAGGMLTPLGDPPLFLLFLKGVEFNWFFNLFPHWALSNFLILVSYVFIDSYFYSKEPLPLIKRDRSEIKPIRFSGKINLLWLSGVVLSVAFLNANFIPSFTQYPYLSFIRETIILLCAYASLKTTPHVCRLSNEFNWNPIIEVAALFLGIFITIVPCILYLQINAPSLGINSPPLFFYVTGLFSAFLDNAPTALTMYSLATSIPHNPLTNTVANVSEPILLAIAFSSVFFGAMTYIGNGPNLMIRSIAENRGVTMPNFFGYILYSLLVLLPISIVIQLVFF